MPKKLHTFVMYYISTKNELQNISITKYLIAEIYRMNAIIRILTMSIWCWLLPLATIAQVNQAQHRHGFVKNGKKRSILLFSNPDSKTARQNMSIKISDDDGKTWPTDKKILLDEEKSRGYSCLTHIDDNTIGILYESSQADMVFQTVKLNELL